jgi:hypothetical protein
MATSFKCTQCEVILIDADDVFEDSVNGEPWCEECFRETCCCWSCEKNLIRQDINIHHIMLMKFDSDMFEENKMCWCCIQQDDETIDEIGEICGGRSAEEIKELFVSILATDVRYNENLQNLQDNWSLENQ